MGKKKETKKSGGPAIPWEMGLGLRRPGFSSLSERDEPENLGANPSFA